jgi:CXXC-20-CXXC protein
MGPSCPRCKKSEFSYREVLSVHPYPGEFSPARIKCPSCGMTSRVTAKSRLVSAGVLLALLAFLVLLSQTGIHLHEWQVLLLAFGTIAVYYFALWPRAVRLKPWTPFQYWLPKSRLVGYSVYLVAPVTLIVLLFYLAVRFGAGM